MEYNYITTRMANNLVDDYVIEQIALGNFIQYIFNNPWTGFVYVTIGTPAIP